MQSIKPKLGSGLGEKKDKRRGKIFPQFKLKNGKNLDDKFSVKPILLYSSDINKTLSNKFNSIDSRNIPGLLSYLNNFGVKAVIVRPDRFILSSIKSRNSFKKFLKKNSNFLV